MALLVNMAIQISRIYKHQICLLPRAQELELEDHQSRLEQKLREKMLKEGECGAVFGALEKGIFPQQDT